ncbi:MAG: ATP-binding protein [Desulfobacterales bacterium]|nr:ATP-binding protein [Desulfobacterales bacterium]
MKKDTNEDKIKPFRLVKYFTFTSLIVIFCGTLVLSVLNTQWARTMQRKKSEDFALLLIENLNHQVFLQFVLPVYLKYGRIQLRNQEQFERLDKIVRSTLHSFNVESVNIYDLNGTISYSFDQTNVGRTIIVSANYQAAIKGRSTSKLIQRGSFWEISFGIPKESRVVTFAPLRAEKPLSRLSGPVLGVVEIVQDLSDEYRNIFKDQIVVVITGAVVMGFLLLVLILVVKRGENIIETRALERLKLEEKLSQAERLSSLGEMTAAISHEIRNPLGIIKSSAEHLKKKGLPDDPSFKIIDIIVEEARRLNSIITDFINFARPRNPNLQPCGVEEIIEKNLNFLSAQAKEQGIQIIKQLNGQSPEIVADKEMLYQAFLNIALNAMQAMPTGGEMVIETKSNDHFVKVIFDDTGEGIADEIISKIWDPFFTSKEKGTGLGLGIVKSIIEIHGGQVNVANKATKGVRVKVKLPIRQEA